MLIELITSNKPSLEEVDILVIQKNLLGIVSHAIKQGYF